MIKVDFLVQTRDGATVTVARSVTVPDLIVIWSIIIKLARKIDEPGSLILVANEAGEVVIRIGVAYARNLAYLQTGTIGRPNVSMLN